jgi:hypothetical protein
VFETTITRRSDVSQEQFWHVVERTASKKRFEQYLSASENDGSQALELYQWNTEICSAFWGQLGHMEIALRNTISNRISLYSQKVYNEDDWIALAQKKEILASGELDRINEAKARVANNKKEISLDQIVSELPLGFWATLLGRRYRNLWPELAGGFLGLASRDSKELAKLVQQARCLRNRIGHHHRIWNLDLENHHLGILRISRMVDPEFERWLSSISPVPELLINRPRAAP